MRIYVITIFTECFLLSTFGITWPQVLCSCTQRDMGCPVIEGSSFWGAHQSRCLPLSHEDGRDGASETVCFLVFRTPDDGRVKNPVILSVTHHRQNPLEDPFLFYLLLIRSDALWKLTVAWFFFFLRITTLRTVALKHCSNRNELWPVRIQFLLYRVAFGLGYALLIIVCSGQILFLVLWKALQCLL
jgi:hypothetical protein